MRIVVMGTGGFAVPSFDALLKSEHEILALFTRPAKPVHGRKKNAVPINPMRALAESKSLEIFDPESANSTEAIEVLLRFAPDLLIVCDYGQILSAEVLKIPKYGGLNLHGSLLPKYRGAAPINWALYHGEEIVGITVIHMTTRLDGGPCLATRSIEVEDDDAVAIEQRLASVGVEAVMDSIQMLSSWDGESTLGELQDRSLVTKAPRLKKSDGLIDWNRTAKQIQCQLRAMSPWPGTFTGWQRNEKTNMRLIVNSLRSVDRTSDERSTPGQIVKADSDGILVATADGHVVIETIQPSGKKCMTAEEFLRGYGLKSGDFFCDPV